MSWIQFSLSALHLACEAGADDCVVTLMNQGAHPNLKDKAGKTPLTIVCDTGNDNCVGPVSAYTSAGTPHK